MGLLSFKDFLRSNPKQKVYIADTSFIIKSVIPNTQEYEVRQKLAGKIGFVYNVIVKKEILHLTRYTMIDHAIRNELIKVNKSIQYIWDNKQEFEHLKQVCDNGYAEMFREVFGAKGEKLQEEVDKVLTGCMYADGKNNANASSWDNALALMSLYGLDSSDAMILNFAVGDATYAGLITSDSDFRVCGDVKSKNAFDIILPEGAKNRVQKSEWRRKA